MWIWLCSGILLFAPKVTEEGLALGKYLELQSVRGKRKFGKLHCSDFIIRRAYMEEKSTV